MVVNVRNKLPDNTYLGLLLHVIVVWLPPPRTLCFRRCLSVCLSVCLHVSNFAQKFGMDLREIFREGWQWASEQMITNNRLDTEIIFHFRHHWEIRKVVNGHSFILIRQMAALVRCALAEVCTVPMPLVNTDLVHFSNYSKFV